MKLVRFLLAVSGTAGQFSKLGGAGVTSDLKWGGGTEETLLLVGLYFFGKLGGGG